MKRERKYDDCPLCGLDILIKDSKMVAHERGLRYVPYYLYRIFEKKHGTSLLEQRRKNLCLGSGKTMQRARAIARVETDLFNSGKEESGYR